MVGLVLVLDEAHLDLLVLVVGDAAGLGGRAVRVLALDGGVGAHRDVGRDALAEALLRVGRGREKGGNEETLTKSTWNLY